MKKLSKQKSYFKKIFKRTVSIALALTLVAEGAPLNLLNLIPHDFVEKTEVQIVAKAAEVDADQLAKYSANSYTFTSNNTYTQNDITYSFVEYSQCFQNATWAADHKNDTLTLNPANGTFIFDANYNPIGNASAPFNGTIILNTTADDFSVQASTPIFEYVKDSVAIHRMQQTGEEAPKIFLLILTVWQM